MPVHRGPNYYQWGVHGKKYYYILGDKGSREAARSKAARQGRAIEMNLKGMEKWIY